jgi:hypothetical protein
MFFIVGKRECGRVYIIHDEQGQVEEGVKKN